MKYIKYLIFTFAILCIYCNVSAATITSSEFKNGKFYVSGEGTGSVQVAIFNADKEPIYMGTVTSIDGKYNLEIPKIAGMSAGDYTIKAAGYNGGESESKVLEVTSEQLNTSNPNTGDNFIIYVILSVLTVFGIGGLLVYIKKNRLFN